MTPELAIRRLSAALGRKITADDIEEIALDYVFLRSGECFALYAGNVAYKAGEGVWLKNGQVWDEAWTETNIPRPLSD